MAMKHLHEFPHSMKMGTAETHIMCPARILPLLSCAVLPKRDRQPCLMLGTAVPAHATHDVRVSMGTLQGARSAVAEGRMCPRGVKGQPARGVGAARAAASYMRASMRKSVGKNTSAAPRGRR